MRAEATTVGCPMKGIADYSLLDANTLASP